MDDVDASVARLRALRAKGFRLAIDDFGTGYSSLSYLQRFPVDILKIDRSFVRNLDQRPVGETDITSLIVLLGHSLRLQIVAEGVETESQWQRLREIGCDEFQGFLFAPPMAAPELEEKFLKPQVLQKKVRDLPAHAAFNYDWRYLCVAGLLHK